MKKLFALAVLVVFTLGFGNFARAEEVRSNSPLSKVEPTAIKQEVPTPEKKAVLAPEEEAKPEEDAIAPEKEATDDLMAPATEEEAPKPDSME